MIVSGCGRTSTPLTILNSRGRRTRQTVTAGQQALVTAQTPAARIVSRLREHVGRAPSFGPPLPPPPPSKGRQAAALASTDAGRTGPGRLPRARPEDSGHWDDRDPQIFRTATSDYRCRRARPEDRGRQNDQDPQIFRSAATSGGVRSSEPTDPRLTPDLRVRSEDLGCCSNRNPRFLRTIKRLDAPLAPLARTAGVAARDVQCAATQAGCTKAAAAASPCETAAARALPVRTRHRPPHPPAHPTYRYWPVFATVSMERPASVPFVPVTSVRM
ncbi:hypothetical protein Ga0074812_11874 [Parafrankia irregularis]|uniref:Uncharacterized protein n=1 Tax=Parafrankia irregularis TaxID=795642 RepID=A0A0S4QT91_9ACTN|nr:hypothetical protein Ga0074812_11874 [Parafrankia irregularis]